MEKARITMAIITSNKLNPCSVRFMNRPLLIVTGGSLQNGNPSSDADGHLPAILLSLADRKSRWGGRSSTWVKYD
jgi:hypothetical protein